MPMPELVDLGRELGAASWVRSTYITQDTAIIASAAGEKYAKWHSDMVQQAMAYDDHELDASTRRATRSAEARHVGTGTQRRGQAQGNFRDINRDGRHLRCRQVLSR